MNDGIRETGRIDGYGGSIHVGTDHGGVAVYVNGWLSADGVTLTQDQAEEFAQLFVAACWQAGENGRQLAEEVHEADGGDSMAACDAKASGYLCTETGPHTVHLARGARPGVILHAWEDRAAQAEEFLRARGDGASDG